MSKAQEKRVRKELDKLLSSGRYWEWLETIERENGIAAHRKEWQEVWQTLGKRAFRIARGCRISCTGAVNIGPRPSFPDIRFLVHLGEFVNGDGGEKAREALASVTGISLSARRSEAGPLLGRGEFPQRRLRDSS